MYLVLAIFLSMTMNTSVINKPSLTYLVREPKVKIEKPPLIILLHGVGSNENDLFSFANQLPDKYLVVAARAPLVVGPSNFAWYEVDFSTGKPVYNQQQEATSRKIILQFIDELKEFHSFDDKQIYLAGFSQGAIMSFTLGLLHPDKVHGVIALSGRILDEIKPLVARDKVKMLKVFIGHGTHDNVLPVHYAHSSQSYLRQLHIEAAFHQYHEGHGISNQELQDLVEWLK